MKKILRKLSLVLVFALIISGIQPANVLAAPKKYVKALSISKKSLNIEAGKSKSLSYKVKVKGKASKKITVKSSNANVKISVKKGKIKITAKKAGNSRITIATKGKNKKGKTIKKIIKVTIVKKNNSNHITPSTDIKGEVTRAEWVSAVMKITGYSAQKELFKHDDDGNISYSFTDILGHANADVIETAAKYGIVPEISGNFRPNSAADREFLAVTSVRALGFSNNETKINCLDKANLKYATEDAIAVQLNLLKLSDNNFYPARVITKAEKQNAEKILSDIIKGRKIDNDHEDVIEYKEDVLYEENVTDYVVSEQNGMCIVEVTSGDLLYDVSEGDKIVLPATDKYPEGLALIVDSSIFSQDGEGQVVTGTIPEEITEFVDAVDIEGMAVAKPGEITAVDGVATVEVATEGGKRNTVSTMAKADGEINLSDKTRISYTVKEIETTVSFNISALKYKVDFNRKGVKELYIGLPNVFSVDTDYKAKKNFSKKIGDIPIELGAGFSANIEVYLEADISGKIKMNLKLSNNIGIQYLNGDFMIEKSCEPNFDAVVDADIDAGAKLQLGLYWMKGIMEIFGKEDPRPIYNISTKWGLHGDAELHTRNDQFTSNKNLICIDLGYYLYGNINVGDGSFLGDQFNLKKVWIIFDSKNSPLKGALHIENGKKVQSCTYKKVNEKKLLEDYAEQFSYLCNDTKTYGVYASYETTSDDNSCFSTTDDIPNKPLTYDIDDYDGDGTVELLVASITPYSIYTDYYTETSKAIYFEMYEVEDNQVIKKAVSDYVFKEYNEPYMINEYTNFYNGTAEIETLIYKYYKDSSLNIAIETYGWADVFADGYDVRFKTLEYDGKDFKNVGSCVCSGSNWFDEDLRYIETEYKNMGINVEAEQLLKGNMSVYDYVINPYIFGRSRTSIMENIDLDTFLNNPSSSYRQFNVYFSQN